MTCGITFGAPTYWYSTIFFSRCKSNYAASQWDEGTHVLIQGPEIFNTMTKGMASAASAYWSHPFGITDKVYQCINASALRGESTDTCLVDYYLGVERGLKLEDYFVYEKIPTETPTQSETMYIDACQVCINPPDLGPVLLSSM